MAVAWEYHEATKHSADSLRRDRHYLDWPNQPRPVKRYAVNLPCVALPRDILPSVMPALQALRSQSDAFPQRAADVEPSLLATLLQLSAGITKWLRLRAGTMAFRAAACTGALYHIDLYLVCGDLPEIEAGVYHFDVENVTLVRLRSGDYRGVLLDAAGGDATVRRAPATLVATSTFWRNSWKYQARTYRHCFWDSGTILANMLAVANAHGLPARVLAGFVDSAVNVLLDIDPDREVAVALVPLGSSASASPPPTPAVRPLGLLIEPLSASEVDYPLIRKVHQASSLATAKEVISWRGAAAGLDGPVAGPADGRTPAHPDWRTGELISLTSEVDSPAAVEPTEKVVRKRGSARRFERSAIPFEALSTIVTIASGGIFADFPALTDMYLIVNAVDGLASGSYYFDPEQMGLEPLSRGDFRDIAGRLYLGQELAADAAVNVYFLADLSAILPALGDRGYRAAQLDASIRAGKMYLAAYSLGLAATGLTFFDDEVTDFFSTHAEGKDVMFLIALGRAG